MKLLQQALLWMMVNDLSEVGGKFKHYSPLPNWTNHSIFYLDQQFHFEHNNITIACIKVHLDSREMLKVRNLHLTLLLIG